jgi:hypothetical protein
VESGGLETGSIILVIFMKSGREPKERHVRGDGIHDVLAELRNGQKITTAF